MDQLVCVPRPPKSKLIVPVGASAAYMGKDYWKEFKTIEEQNAEAATSYTVTVQDMSGIKFVPVTESSEVAPGTKYEFKVETDDSYGTPQWNSMSTAPAICRARRSV